MSDLISRQAAIDATTETVFVEYEENADKEESIILQTKVAIRDRIKALPSVYVPDTNVGDMISRQAAIDALREIYEFISKQEASETTDGVMEILDAVITVPPAQLGTNLAEVGTDCISRSVELQEGE